MINKNNKIGMPAWFTGAGNINKMWEVLKTARKPFHSF